ncbi:hypothetical protein HPB47_023092 [Ixodes persulcatus]|uniref:Uncharacterized protein n=1 Tax=Ixodes persulcatus TaxID=34615 RepID=A0AC60QBA2_IXOPE|nr:hypothetical protein HPB47_023092 [Ixodes persulcatus]
MAKIDQGAALFPLLSELAIALPTLPMSNAPRASPTGMTHNAQNATEAFLLGARQPPLLSQAHPCSTESDSHHRENTLGAYYALLENAARVIESLTGALQTAVRPPPPTRPPVRISIPTYRGYGDRDLQKYQQAMGMSDHEILERIFPISLVDQAARWLRLTGSQLSSIEHSNDGPNTQESLLEFVRAMQELFELAEPSAPNTERVERVIRQSHPTFAGYLRGSRFRDLNELASEWRSKREPGFAARALRLCRWARATSARCADVRLKVKFQPQWFQPKESRGIAGSSRTHAHTSFFTSYLSRRIEYFSRSCTELSLVPICEKEWLVRLELELERVREEDRPGTSGGGAELNLMEEVLSFSRLMKGVLAQMPSSELLVPSWFDGVENVFATYEVHERLRGSLVRPYFTEHMRALVNRLPVGEGSDYGAVKERIEGSSGRVTLTRAFGDSVSALLRHVPMALPTRFVEYILREVPILCAVTDRLVAGTDMLLTPDDYDNLNRWIWNPKTRKTRRKPFRRPMAAFLRTTARPGSGSKIKPRGPSPEAQEHTLTGNDCENKGPYGETKDPRRDKADPTQGHPKASSCSRHGGSQAWDAVVSKRPRPKRKRQRRISAVRSGDDASCKERQWKRDERHFQDRKLSLRLRGGKLQNPHFKQPRTHSSSAGMKPGGGNDKPRTTERDSRWRHGSSSTFGAGIKSDAKILPDLQDCDFEPTFKSKDNLNSWSEAKQKRGVG